MPDPGQRVRLRTGRGRWRGRFRAVSAPYTDAGGLVMVRVAEEGEYRDALREGRRATGVPWPAEQIEVVRQAAPEKSSQDSRPPRERSEVPWWRNMFGG